MNMKYFGLSETKLFHLHRIFKNGGQGGGFKKTHMNPSGSATDRTSQQVHNLKTTFCSNNVVMTSCVASLLQGDHGRLRLPCAYLQSRQNLHCPREQREKTPMNTDAGLSLDSCVLTYKEWF